MDDYKTRTAREFSTFWLPNSWMGAARRSVGQDKRLQHLMESLIDPEIELPHDAWARYFLLTLFHTDAQYLETLQPPLADRTLLTLIAYWVAIAAEPNGGTLAIARQIAASQPSKPIQDFLNRADTWSRDLLSLYLQPKCFYLSGKWFSRQPEQREEYFSLALSQISDPKALLRGFDFARPHTSIRAFAEKVLEWAVTSDLRKRDGTERTKAMSNEGLLKRLSRRDLEETLSAAGKDAGTLHCYRMVLDGFREVYAEVRQKGRNQRLPPPTPEQLEAIAQYYSQRRSELPHLPPLTVAQVPAILAEICQLIRQSHSQETFHQQLLEEYPTQVDPWNALDTTTDRDQLHQRFAAAFASLPAPIQHLFYLRYGLGMTQSEICTVLGSVLQVKQQYGVSRLLEKQKRHLLQPVLEQMLADHQILPLSRPALDQTVQSVSQVLDGYLTETLCRPFFAAALRQAIAPLAPSQRDLLRCHYRLRLFPAAIAAQSQQAVAVTQTDLERLQTHLQTAVITWIEQTLEISLHACRSVPDRVTALIADALETDEFWKEV